MGLIKITTVDAEFLEVDFGVVPARWSKLKIERNATRSVGQLSDDGGVELIFVAGDNFQLHCNYVDDVNGVNPTTNSQLYDLLNGLMTV